MPCATACCRLENGTTYNSYLIFGDKVALVDASHEKFHNLYLQQLQAELQKAGRGIDYIFVSHTEPDHSGLVPAVLDLYPEATVVGSKVGRLKPAGSGQHRPAANTLLGERFRADGASDAAAGSLRSCLPDACMLAWPDCSR